MPGASYRVEQYMVDRETVWGETDADQAQRLVDLANDKFEDIAGADTIHTFRRDVHALTLGLEESERERLRAEADAIASRSKGALLLEIVSEAVPCPG